MCTHNLNYLGDVLHGHKNVVKENKYSLIRNITFLSGKFTKQTLLLVNSLNR